MCVFQLPLSLYTYSAGRGELHMSNLHLYVCLNYDNNRRQLPEARRLKYQVLYIPVCHQDITFTTTSTPGSCLALLSVLLLLHQLFLISMDMLVLQSPCSYNSIFTSRYTSMCSPHSKLPKGQSHSHSQWGGTVTKHLQDLEAQVLLTLSLTPNGKCRWHFCRFPF